MIQGCAMPSKRAGRGHSRGAQSREGEKGLLFAQELSTLRPLSWGSGGGCWPDGEQPAWTK